MKYLFSMLLLAAITTSLKAQPNTFPTNGNVGIGTTTPAFPLQVTGEANANSFRVLSGLGDNINGAPWYGIGISNVQLAGQWNVVQLAGFYGLNFKTAAGQLVMTGSGYVGIGTTIPTSAFQVDEGVSKVSIGSAGDEGSSFLNSGTGYVGLNAARFYSSGNMQNWLVSSDQQHNGGGAIFGDILGDIYLSPITSTGASDQILSDADIANRVALKIGHDGIVYAKQIIVQTTAFPDYVFKPS